MSDRLPSSRGAMASAAARPHLPDPATTGPYRPFATDPGWHGAWWWLALPVLVLAGLIATSQRAPNFYDTWVIPEGYGVLEVAQFAIMLVALALAVRLLFNPFVRRRPFVLTVTIIAALSSLYIAGEEMSWGQHFFHWNTPEYWALVNRQQETNLHNTYAVFEKYPRAILEIGVVDRRHHHSDQRQLSCRVSAPSALAVLPAGGAAAASLIVFAIKIADMAVPEGPCPRVAA